MSEKTVAVEVVESLRDLGVRHVFGVPSGGWVDYMEALRVTDGIEFVLATHEGGAAFMADVCGRLTAAPGVCFGTFGPGATNLATGVGSALLDRSPLIALTDEMPAAMRGRTTQMGIDHQALFAPLTKRSTRLTAEDPRGAILEAGRLALAERPGPVHIGLPVGLSAERVRAGSDPERRGDPVAVPMAAASESTLGRAATLLAEARMPLLVLGLAAVRAALTGPALALAQQLQAPVVLTPMAKGMLSEKHPLYAGVLFHALSDVVAQTYAQADVVVAVGYDPVEFNYEQWLGPVSLLNLDTRPADIDRRLFPAVVDVVGAIADSLDYLSARCPPAGGWDLAALAERRTTMFQHLSSRSTGFGPCAALEVLRSVFPVEGILCCDVGAHLHLIGQKWSTPAPGKLLMTNGWSAMGFGIPAAIAARLCHPDLPVCCVAGDGGFLMTVGELAVAVRLQLDILFVVFSDNDLALIRIKQERKHNPVYGTPVRDGGTIGGDNLFGVPVLRAADADSFLEAIERAGKVSGPVIVEALIDSREYDGLVLRRNKL